MSKREYLPETNNVPIIEPEIVEDIPWTQKNILKSHARNGSNELLVQKLAESLPAVIILAREIIELKTIEAKTAQEIAQIQSQCDLLNAQAEKFVSEERERRTSITSKGQQAVGILSELTKALQSSNLSPEVQTELIRAYDRAFERVCGISASNNNA